MVTNTHQDSTPPPPPPTTHTTHCLYMLYFDTGKGGGGWRVEPERRLRVEGQQFTKLGRKYQQNWMYLQSINSGKHLPQSTFTGQFFWWRHFALLSTYLINPWIIFNRSTITFVQSLTEKLPVSSSVSCNNLLWQKYCTHDYNLIRMIFTHTVINTFLILWTRMLHKSKGNSLNLKLKHS